MCSVSVNVWTIYIAKYTCIMYASNNELVKSVKCLNCISMCYLLLFFTNERLCKSKINETSIYWNHLIWTHIRLISPTVIEPRASHSRNISACTISCESLQIERGNLEDNRCYNLRSSCYYMWNRVRTKVAPDLIKGQKTQALKLVSVNLPVRSLNVSIVATCNLFYTS